MKFNPPTEAQIKAMIEAINDELPEGEKLSKNKKKYLGRDAALRMIRAQFGNTSEHKLCFAIVDQAITDLKASNSIDEDSAKSCLQGTIHAAEICGVSSKWIRHVLRGCGLDYKTPAKVRRERLKKAKEEREGKFQVNPDPDPDPDI